MYNNVVNSKKIEKLDAKIFLKNVGVNALQIHKMDFFFEVDLKSTKDFFGKTRINSHNGFVIVLKNQKMCKNFVNSQIAFVLKFNP